jgi:hypothetical protein
MRNLTLNEAHSISGSLGIFTELGENLAKVITAHTLHTLRTTDCLPNTSRNGVIAGLTIYTIAAATVGYAIDEASNTISSLLSTNKSLY